MSHDRPEGEGPDDDALLIGGLQRGDAEAIERFYSEYYQTFLRVMIRLVGDFHTAQDLAHEAILRAIAGAGTYRPGPGRTPRAWFMAVLRSTFLDWLRRAKVRRTTPLAPATDTGGAAIQLPTNEPTPHDRVEAAEKIGAVQAAMMMLDEEQRLLITLRMYEGLSAPDTAEVLGITTELVGGRLHRAKNRLREILEGNWPDLFR